MSSPAVSGGARAVGTLAVAGDRSLRDLRLSLGRLGGPAPTATASRASTGRSARLPPFRDGGVVRVLALEGGLPRGSDGADLAAAIAPIEEVGDRETLAAAVDDAFGGASLRVLIHDDGHFELVMRQPGLLRRSGWASSRTERSATCCCRRRCSRRGRPRRWCSTRPRPACTRPSLRHSRGFAARGGGVAGAGGVAFGRSRGGLIEAGADAIVLAGEFGGTVAVAAEPPPWTWPRC